MNPLAWGKFMKKTFKAIELSNKQIEALLGFNDSLLRDGATVIIFPEGEKDHPWNHSGSIKGDAFIALVVDDTAPIWGFVGVSKIAGGYAYEVLPAKSEWQLSSDKVWWVGKSISDPKTPGYNWGVSQHLKGVVASDGSTLQAPIILEDIKIREGFTGSVVKRSGSRKPSGEIFNRIKTWSANVRWADQEDLKILEIAAEGDARNAVEHWRK